MLNYKKNIAKAFTIFLVLFSLMASSFSLHNEEPSDKKVKTESPSGKKENKKTEELSEPTAFVAVIPFFQFELIQDLYLIISLEFVKDLYKEVFLNEPIYQSKYLKNLFCFVISPNAP